MARPTRREHVLDAAARLFAVNGYATTSLRVVAESASLTKAGLYYHFPEKDDLLYGICAFSIETILDGARRAVAELKAPHARLAALIQNHADFFWSHPDNLIVLNRDLMALPEPARTEIRELERAYLDLIRDAIRDGQSQGVFAPVDPTVAAFSVLATLNTLDRWYDPSGPVPPSELVRQVEFILCNGLSVRPGAAAGDMTT